MGNAFCYQCHLVTPQAIWNSVKSFSHKCSCFSKMTLDSGKHLPQSNDRSELLTFHRNLYNIIGIMYVGLCMYFTLIEMCFISWENEYDGQIIVLLQIYTRYVCVQHRMQQFYCVPFSGRMKKKTDRALISVKNHWGLNKSQIVKILVRTVNQDKS